MPFPLLTVLILWALLTVITLGARAGLQSAGLDIQATRLDEDLRKDRGERY